MCPKLMLLTFWEKRLQKQVGVCKGHACMWSVASKNTGFGVVRSGFKPAATSYVALGKLASACLVFFICKMR